MADVDSANYTDIKTAGSGFSFTGNLSKFAINDRWTGGYDSILDNRIPDNEYTFMWKAISSGMEDAGNTFYKTIRNYIDEIGNIDTCGLEALKNYSEILGYKNDYIDVNISFPIEIKNLIEIFSVNPAYLYNKATDGSEDTLVLSNSILHYSTVEQFLSALKNKDEYSSLVDNVFYNTITDFLNLKTTSFDDSKNGTEQVEIWKTDTDRFVNGLWGDDVTSEKDIYALKDKLGVSKSFTEKTYADDIISGKRSLSDFSDIEQSVIKAEIISRETRYGDSNSMRYYYMRLFKVVEYFRFSTIAYNNAYNLKEYDIDENKYSIVSNNDNRLSLLKFNYNEYEIDFTAIRKVSQWLANLSFGIRKAREEMKSQCKRNMMVGTKRLIVDIIRNFILDKIDGEIVGDLRDSILHSAGLNKKFGVSIIEYSDMTEYFNIENQSDAVKPSDYGLHSRYWEMYDDCENAFTKDDVLSFYNRLFGDSKKFVENTANGKTTSSDNLYEFLSILFESGATATTNSEYYLSSDLYVADGGMTLSSVGRYSLSDEDKEKIAKYSGDMYFGKTPYANHKNLFHPSYQMHPFLQAFEEYDEAYTSVMNLVNSYTESINDSYRRLDERLDSLGNTINFWYNWNDDFSGYSTTYEKSGSDFDIKTSQDGPFNFSALQDFISHPAEYINNILNGVNKFYFDSSTGKQILTLEETRLEVARLQKYSTMISSLAGREIYKYGKDYNGNIYILYKGKGNRTTRNALGDVWVRLRNHPIAFPLFDLSLSPVRFNETSCIKETDNSKLISILTKIYSFFHESYGKHVTDNTVLDGSVDLSDISLSIRTYTESVPVTTREFGADIVSSFSFQYNGVMDNVEGNFRLVDIYSSKISDFAFSSSMKDMVVFNLSGIEELSSLGETYYFVDSIDGSILPGGDASTYIISSSDGVEDPNPTGKVISLTDDNFFNAEYNSKLSTIEILPNRVSTEKKIIFADYDDKNSFDGKYYYCLNKITGKTHPCTKRTVNVRRLFSMPFDSLSGTVLENGNVLFGGDVPRTDVKYGSGESPFYRYDVDVSESESMSSALDGGSVYEDFRRFSYYVIKNGHSYAVDPSEIVIVGGSNPYHMTRDENGELALEEAYQMTPSDYSDVIEFSDSNYRIHISAPVVLSSFSFSSCEFVTAHRDGYSDTIGQFYLRDNPYTLYQPFTVLSGNPFRESNRLSVDSPTGSITLYGDDGENVVFYYNLGYTTDGNYDRHVSSMRVNYELYTATLKMTSCNFGGKIEFTPYDSSEYPIYLDFTKSNCDNTAVYSSFMSEISQQKFFDMGFSYNQKLFYLSYSDGSNEYLSGGTIVGTLTENFDENYNSSLSLYRDGSHNVEYVDSKTSFFSSSEDMMFHIGDSSSKIGIISVFGKYSEKNRTLEVSITTFSSNDVKTQKFSVDVRNGLYEFDSGSKYSFSTSCTDERLYISFTTNAPDDDDVISNTVNGMNDGVIGSTKFGDIRDGFMDFMVQIASFDITDDEISYMPSETRYILGGGEIGYFQQFSGILGKNNVFSNTKLSSDSEFPIQPQFGEVCGDTDIEFLHTYESAIYGFENNRTVRYFDRYVNLLPYTETNSDEISGFLVEDGHDKALLSVACSGRTGESFEFSNFDGRSIIDITRGLDGDGYEGIVNTFSELARLADVKDGLRYMVLDKTVNGDGNTTWNNVFEYSSAENAWKFVESKPNHGVNVISDGMNSYNRCAAFVEGTDSKNAVDVCGKKMVLIPVHSDVEEYTRFDFSEMIDFEGGFRSLHSDGKTVSVVSVSSGWTKYNPVTGICEYNFVPYGIVDSVSSLPKEPVNGTMYAVSNGDGEESTVYRFIEKYGKWIECEISKLDEELVDLMNLRKPVIKEGGYSSSSSTGGNSCFGIFQDRIATWFGAYGDNTVLQCEQGLPSNNFTAIPFTIGNGIPALLYPLSYSGGNDFTIPFTKYGAFLINRTDSVYDKIDMKDYFGLPEYAITLYGGETVENLVSTSEDDIKLISTSMGHIYKYDVSKGKITLSHTFDELNKTLDIDSTEDFEAFISETSNHILVSYWSEEKNSRGVLITRKNTPDSIAETVNFFDESGNRKIDVDKIVKFLSVGNIVLSEEVGGGRIFISKDDGLSFRLMNGVGDTMNLIGCGTNRFYARYGNGEKVYSTNGEKWFNIKDIHASNWNVFNASGVDYISCSKIDGDMLKGVLETDKYLNITEQFHLEGDYRFDRICVDDSGNIVCVSGIDGDHEMTIARMFRKSDGGYSDIEYIKYPYVRNIVFSDITEIGGGILLSPSGGNTALLIENAFSENTKTSTRFIDISNATNDEINVFGGFGNANGRLIMYPSEGSSVLTYDKTNSKFHMIHSFGQVMTLCDCDSINLDKNNDAILSPRSSSINGIVKFSRTMFDSRNDYGIIEIDEGFPILITYHKMTTFFFGEQDDYGDVSGDVYKITFNFMNDVNRKSVSILSFPSNMDGEFPNMPDYGLSQAEDVYIVNGKSIKYLFRSVDSSNKFIIERKFSEFSTIESNPVGLTIELLLRDSEERENVSLNYSLSSVGGTGRFCVFGNISDNNPSYSSEV